MRNRAITVQDDYSIPLESRMFNRGLQVIVYEAGISVSPNAGFSIQNINYLTIPSLARLIITTLLQRFTDPIIQKRTYSVV